MWTPLGPTFPNFYASNLEETVFKEDPSLKPPLYCRYMDDIFLVIDKYDQLITLKNAFEKNSVLKFTYEVECQKKMSFLDTLITRSQ